VHREPDGYCGSPKSPIPLTTTPSTPCERWIS
jgi:hypothetical protein